MIFKRTIQAPNTKITVQRVTLRHNIEIHTTSGYENLAKRDALRLAEMLLAACNQCE